MAAGGARVNNALISSLAGGLAPILGGLCAQLFAERRVGLVLEWSGPLVRSARIGIDLTGWDFYFVLSALCGLYALHRLALVHEDGELGRREMMEVVFGRSRSLFGRPPAAAGAAPPDELSEDLFSPGPSSR